MENELRRLGSGQQGRKQCDFVTDIFKVIRRFFAKTGVAVADFR